MTMTTKLDLEHYWKIIILESCSIYHGYTPMNEYTPVF